MPLQTYGSLTRGSSLLSHLYAYLVDSILYFECSLAINLVVLFPLNFSDQTECTETICSSIFP